MKKLTIAIFLVLAVMTAKSDIDLNGLWDFRLDEKQSLDKAFNADFKATDKMTVPGCFDMMPKFLMKRGTAHYRRTFDLEKDVKNAWLEVKGMGLTSRFSIDGKIVGGCAYPWSTFRIALGPLKKGTHTLYAALDNRFDFKIQKLIRPYYDFYAFGGFYHGVSLKFDNRSLRIRTRDIATGTVEVEFVNFEKSDFTTALKFDGKNSVVADVKSSRATVKVPSFKLWSPDSPNLHTVESEDGVKARFGIRTVEAKNKRIYLNGKPLFLKGANRHESHITFGAATSEDLMLLDVQNLKALGGNFFRGAHYPQTERFLDLCDEYGILVWEESLGWGNGQPWTDHRGEEFKDPRFLSDNIAQTKLMVENSFNHPSVIIYAFLNELNSTIPEGKKIVDELIGAIKEYDSGRLVTYACNRVNEDIANVNTDIISFNTYPGWIGSDAGDNDNLKKLLKDSVSSIVKRFRSKYPEKPIMVSEMGTCGVYGWHDAAGAQWTEEFEAEYVSEAIKAAWSEKDIVGFAIWQFTDARSYHREGGAIRSKPFALNLAGIYDAYRRPKLPVLEAVKKSFAETPDCDK